MFPFRPEAPVEDIIGDLTGAVGATLNGRIPGAPLIPFAALLVKLSREADARTRRVICLTWALVALTAALLMLTAYLAWHEANKQADQNGGLNTKSHAQQAKP